MLYSFFTLAAVSPQRQQAFRRTIIAHVAVLGGGIWALHRHASPEPSALLGQLLLIAGIIEGAILLGWRLTQLPRSRALEFLLASPLWPPRIFLAEALVGLTRLALATLSSLPVLLLLTFNHFIDELSIVVYLMMAFTWGAITGLGLAVWAYEPLVVRRWGERLVLLGIVAYLSIGVLAGEHLRSWLAGLPGSLGSWCLTTLWALHAYNPFSVLAYWHQQGPWIAGDRIVGLELSALVLVGILLIRAAGRLQSHFHERHYQPIRDRHAGERRRVGDRPLCWWAVRRVSEYSGRINLWLAGGFCLLYAIYTIAGDSWPRWLGRSAFGICDMVGGIPILGTGLVLLAAVPAAFQYGLWDSNAQDRCRRLELLLMTRLRARDYWDAAAAAAWQRGQGYFVIAVLLWLSAAGAGQIRLLQLPVIVASSVLLWGLYFALGFRAFSHGVQANSLGLGLTLGLPLLTMIFFQAGWIWLGDLVPPGAILLVTVEMPSWAWLPGPLAIGGATLWTARHSLASCEQDLRLWYEQQQGRKIIS